MNDYNGTAADLFSRVSDGDREDWVEKVGAALQAAHAAGAAAERARWVALLNEYAASHKRDWNGGDPMVLLALNDLLKAVRQ